MTKLSSNSDQRLFGTDGIRGTVNAGKVNALTAVNLAMAAGGYFYGKAGTKKSRVLIGKDTRLSGYMLEPALVAGFTSVGLDSITTGPLPTPAIAHLTRVLRCDLGVMISASHNPYEDNGLKLFGADGFKLNDEVENEIQLRMEKGPTLAKSELLGRARRMEDAIGRYSEFVKQILPKHQDLNGIKVVLDCANGASYKVGPEVFFELGAEAIVMGVEPNGRNINLDCGAMFPNKMANTTKLEKADLGIALDGDADRVIFSDENGDIIHGDQIIALLAKEMKINNELNNDKVVGTLMSNLGLEKFLKDLKINYLTVHISSGLAALKAVKKVSGSIKIVGVTTLTSLNNKDLKLIGYNKSVKNLVLHQAKLAKRAALDALVCSPYEVDAVRKIFKKEIITPGIQIGKRNYDQKRSMEAKKVKSDWLMIGRAITAHGNIKKNIQNLIEKLR